jgi:hypothetical protein
MRRVILMAAVALAALFASGAQAAEEKLGISIQGQFGAGNAARDVSTDVNVVYGLIFGFHFVGPFALELDYHHAENDFSGTGGNSKLKQDALFGHVRLDFISGSIVPFIYTGVGWVRFRADASVLNETVDRAVIPGGVGVEFHVAPILVGARGEYEWNTAKIAGKAVDYWKAVGTVGFQF